MKLNPGEFCATVRLLGDSDAVLLRARYEHIPGILTDEELIAATSKRPS